MKSRNEIDFLRLLRQCQKIAEEKSWRLEKYVDASSEKLDKLRNQNVNHISRDTLEEYGRKIKFLKGLIDTEKLPSAEKRLLAAELLAPDKETKSTYLITTNKYYNQMRQDLLLSNRRAGVSKDSKTASYSSTTTKNTKINSNNKKAQRSSTTTNGADANADDDDNDDDITENLLELTNNIRENLQAANAIIQKDTETLSKVSGGADTVSLKMQTNTDKLNVFVRKGFQIGIWVALVLVTFTFLMMVLFIRLFPK